MERDGVHYAEAVLMLWSRRSAASPSFDNFVPLPRFPGPCRRGPPEESDGGALAEVPAFPSFELEDILNCLLRVDGLARSSLARSSRCA